LQHLGKKSEFPRCFSVGLELAEAELDHHLDFQFAPWKSHQPEKEVTNKAS
jgi:hypothetical protein